MLIDLKQEGQEWLDWRRQGVTASMIASIMGLSPYKSSYELWAEVVGFKEVEDLSSNPHVERGKKLESEARCRAEEHLKAEFQPACWVSDENPIFRASLDGVSLDEEGNPVTVLEIKCPSQEVYDEIIKMKGKSKHFTVFNCQIQWQMFVTGVTSSKLFIYRRGNEAIAVNVKLNPQFVQNAKQKAVEFWECVKTGTPPQMTKCDKHFYSPQKDLDKSEWDKNKLNLIKKREQLRRIKQEIKACEEYFEGLLIDKRGLHHDDMKITLFSRSGSVDWKSVAEKIAEKHSIDISPFVEDFTKESSTSIRITPGKKSVSEAKNLEVSSLSDHEKPVGNDADESTEQKLSDVEITQQHDRGKFYQEEAVKSVWFD